MALRVETVMMGPQTSQYAGQGQAATGVAGIAAQARSLEELGFDGITTPEAGHDPFLPLAIAAEHTTRARLGTNVAIAFPRSPMVTAQCAWDLQGFSGGFTMIPPFFNPGPIAHPHIPIHVAAVNPYMARMAAEICDGLRLHPVATFAYTREVLLPAIAAGAAKAGRDAAAFELIGAPFLALGRDEEELRKSMDALRQHISFYASTRSYHAVLAHHGWEDTGLELHRLSVAGKGAQMPALISDEMLEQWAVVALHDDFAQKLRERANGVFATVLIDLPAAARADTGFVRETVQRLRA